MSAGAAPGDGSGGQSGLGGLGGGSGAGAPPPATPPGGGGTDPGGGGGGQEFAAWTEGWQSPELRELVTTKKYQNAEELAQAYMHAQKKLGVPSDRLVEIPNDWTDPEKAARFYEAVGRPAGPEAYEVRNVPSEPGAQAFVDAAKAKAFELGLRPDQLQGMLDWTQGLTRMGAEADAREAEAKQAASEAKLREVWNDQYDANMAAIRATMPRIGVTPEIGQALVDALGFQAANEWAMGVVRMAGEPQAGFGGGAGAGLGGQFLDANTAKAEHERLLKTPDFVKRYNAGDPEAKRTVERLVEIMSSSGERVGHQVLR